MRTIWTGERLGAQLWLGDDLHQDAFVPATSRPPMPGVQKPQSKPAFGLWTSSKVFSPIPPGFTSAWVDYRAENTRAWLNPYEDAWWELTPRADSRVLVIAKPSDFDAYLQQFPFLPDAMSNKHHAIAALFIELDFDAIRDGGFDAVHLTYEAQRALHHRYMLEKPDLYTWDVESTVWLTWAFADVREVKSITRATHDGEITWATDAPALPRQEVLFG